MTRPLIFLASWLAVVALGVAAASWLPRQQQAQPAPTATAVGAPNLTPTAPATVPSLTFGVPTGAVAPGSSFDLTVLLSSPVVTRGAQFGLAFDPTLVMVTGVDEGTYYRIWAQANGASTAFMPVEVDAQDGWLEPVGIALEGGQPTSGPTGSGMLATVHFQAKTGASGNATVTFESVTLGTLASNLSVVDIPSVQVTDGVLAVGASASAAIGIRPAARRMAPNTPGPWTKRGYRWPTPTPGPGYREPGPLRTPTHSPAEIRAIEATARALPTRTPLPPCPKSVTPSIATLDQRRMPPMPMRGFTFTNVAELGWQDRVYDVEAGYINADPTVGVFVVRPGAIDVCRPPPPLSQDIYQYDAPGHHGVGTITGIDGQAVAYTTADGTSGRLDVTTGQFTGN